MTQSEWKSGSAEDWLRTCDEPTKCERRGKQRFVQRLILVVLLLIAIGLATRSAYGQPSSEQPDVVELTVAEADSILKTIDDLEIALWECEQLAAQDTAYYEDRLRLQERSYETILEAYKDERQNWMERLLRQPVIWLALGAWIGVQAN